MATGAPGAIVWGEDRDLVRLFARTRRALVAFGLPIRETRGLPALGEALREAGGPVWLVRAGAWPVMPFEPPPRSATGRILIAFGAVLGESSEASTWRTIGDLERGPLPAALSVWIEAPLPAAFEAVVDYGLPGVLARLRDSRKPRMVRAATLDVEYDPRLRVAEIVTSLQQGGAERVALDLARALPSHGVFASLAVLGAPTRAALLPPAGVPRLEWRRDAAVARAHGLRPALCADGIDVAHAHLLDADEVRGLQRSDLPVVVTVHNQRPGWPTGTATFIPGDARLLVACSRSVEHDLRDAGLDLPCRTVWNGIDFARVAAPPAPDDEDWRKRLGLGSRDFVLLALANPRPQKRLERLPPILHELRRILAARGIDRQARLIVAGAPSQGSPEGSAARDALREAVETCGLRDHVWMPGSVSPVAPLIRAADVLVSTSAHEGLALSHLEALACDRPVVTTAVGGAPELAARAAGVTLLAANAPPAEFAAVLAEMAAASGERPRLAAKAAVHFDLGRMTEGYARLLRAAARRPRGRERSGLLLVANNFSTGGAQSSARRLLLSLKQRGVAVRAAVIQEQPAFPTPGRRALEAAGVPVLSMTPPPETDPAAAVEQILDWADRAPPQAIVLWNVIAQHKLLIADAAFDQPVFDVSPGEMYFESLERTFACPRPGLPYTRPDEYGARLAGVVVKYADEGERARQVLHAPVHVIPNGIDLAPPRVRTPARGRLTVGTLARLDPRKHVDRLLRAWRLAAPRLPPHVLRIGGGPEPGAAGYLDTLKGLADGLAVEFVGEAEPAAFLSELDLFVLVAEPAGCPNASLEAMAAGVPVVATDAGGMREQIVDGVSGRLVPREDEDALAAALVALASDEEARRRLGTAGRDRVRERFSMDAMVEAYLALLAQN